MPCELVAEPYLARVRYYAVKNLYRKGLRQTEIADLLAISQGLVSSTLKKTKKPSGELERTFEKLARKVGNDVAELLLLKGKKDVATAIEKVCNTCKLLRINGPTCTLHFETYPELQEIKCNACHGGTKSIDLIRADRFQIINELKQTAGILNKIPGVVNLVPEIGMQMVYAVEHPRQELDVAGFPGRIRKHKGSLLYSTFPEFGASTHTARIILLIVDFFPSARCLITIKSSSIKRKNLEDCMVVHDLSFDTLKNSEIRAKLSTLRASIPMAFIGAPEVGIEGITYIVAENLLQIINAVKNLASQI